MKWTVTMCTEKYVDCDEMKVRLEKNEKTFECPFEFRQDVFYVYPEHRLFRKDRWVVLKTKIAEVWATNIFGVCLEGGNHIPEDWFDRLFTDREAAIEFCFKKNQQSKVKIYNE